MRIGIDIRSIAAAGPARGLGVYAARLVEHLVRLAPDGHHYVLFLARNQPVPDFLSPLPAHVTLVRLRRPSQTIVLWDQLLWFRQLRRSRIDLFHSLVYGVPMVSPCPRLLIIYDVTPLLFPHAIRKFRHRAVFRFNYLTARFADHILAISANTGRDAVRLLSIPAARVSVVPAGVGPEYAVLNDPAACAQTAARYGLAGRYILYVGGFDPHKNLRTAIRAFAQVRARLGPSKPLMLACVGKWGPGVDEVHAAVADAKLQEQVVLPGYVPTADVVRLLNGAAAFVLPSWYEGFGLPVVEAMACGTPVVCSNAGSLPEVAGDAALQCPPDKPDAFCDALHAILTSPTLAARLRRKGLARAAQFSWEAAARDTAALYSRMMSP